MVDGALPLDIARRRGDVLIALSVAALASLGLMMLGEGWSIAGGVLLGVVWGALFLVWLVWPKPDHGQAGILPLHESADKAAVFLSSAGHDLRQPAQAIALFAATLSSHPLPDASRKLVAGIEAAVQQLSGQMEAIFGIAKVEAGRVSISVRPVGLEACFAGGVAAHLDDAHERRIHLRHVRTRMVALADDAVLMKILDRLLVHALERTTEGGGVLLGARLRGETIVIEIRDGGSCFPAEMQPLVFEPGSAYGQQFPDRGFGLVLARRLADLMGGHLSLQPGKSRGCVWRLVLPRGMAGQG